MKMAVAEMAYRRRESNKSNGEMKAGGVSAKMAAISIIINVMKAKAAIIRNGVSVAAKSGIA